MSFDHPNQPADAPQPSVPAAPAPAAASGRRASLLGSWGARIVLIVVAACALVSVVFILFGAGGNTIGRVVTTDVALIVFALLVWLDTVIGAYREEWFEFASLATDAYLLLLWITTIWTETDTGAFGLWVDIWRCFLSLLFVRGMLALVDLVHFLYSRWATQVTRALAFVSAIAIGVIAVMVTIPSPAPFNGLWDAEYYGRVIAALAVIAGVALVLIPLWGLLINRNRGTRRTPAPVVGPYPGYGMPYGYGQGPMAGYPQQVPVPVPVPPVPAAPPTAPPAVTAPPAPAASSAVPQPSAVPGSTPSPVGAAAHASHPPLAWPRLRDGSPVPARGDGAPDFAAVAGHPLAWPTFADGTPVPAAPDGSPLYR